MTSSIVTLVTFLAFRFFIAMNQSGTYAFTIKLMPIDRVDKSLFPENLTLEERYERISEISLARFRQFGSATSMSSVERKETTEYEPHTLQPEFASHQLGFYVTSLTVSLHSYNPFLVVDTGSAETWMQCEGCTECFEIKEGNFNRHESRSYRPLPCNDTRCYPKLCRDGYCIYETMYLGSGCDRCYGKGVVGLETFSFQDDKRAIKRFPNTAFGCGLQNHGFRWGKIGKSDIIAGILGLGIGPRSIISQYRNETRMRMSYCLPPWNPTTGKYGLLYFGNEAQISARARTTRLLPNVSPWYAINVMGISFAGSRLPIDRLVFRIRPNHTGGFILDSGSPQTLLVRIAYDVVRSAITEYFSRAYHWQPRPSTSEHDLCYDLPHGNYTLPNMAYHFEGADLFLSPRNIFAASNGGFCLVIMPTENGRTSVLGSFQQANHRFLFDLETLTVSFVPEVCGHE